MRMVMTTTSSTTTTSTTNTTTVYPAGICVDYTRRVCVCVCLRVTQRLRLPGQIWQEPGIVILTFPLAAFSGHLDIFRQRTWDLSWGLQVKIFLGMSSYGQFFMIFIKILADFWQIFLADGHFDHFFPEHIPIIICQYIFFSWDWYIVLNKCYTP